MIKKKKFKISGMHCVSCATTVEWDVEDLGAKAKCSYAKQLLEVEYDEEKLDEGKIKEAVKKNGFEII